MGLEGISGHANENTELRKQSNARHETTGIRLP